MLLKEKATRLVGEMIACLVFPNDHLVSFTLHCENFVVNHKYNMF